MFLKHSKVLKSFFTKQKFENKMLQVLIYQKIIPYVAQFLLVSTNTGCTGTGAHR